MFKNVKGLDELQLIKRGNAFKHAFFTLVGSSLVNILLVNHVLGIEWAEGGREELTIVLFSLMVLIAEFAWHGIIPFGEKQQKAFMVLYAVTGLFLVGVCVYDLVFEHAKIFFNGQVTPSALVGFYGIMFIMITVVYMLRQITLKKEDAAQDE